MKTVNILKIEENKKYIEEKDYIIKGIDDEGEWQGQNPNLNLLRLWLDYEFPFDITNNRILNYSIKFIFENKSSNKSLRAVMMEKGIDNNKHYVLAEFLDYREFDYSLDDYQYCKKIFEIAQGEFEVDIYFCPKMIINGDKVVNYFNYFPSFHDAELTIVKYTEEEAILRFHDALDLNLPNKAVEQYLLELTIRDIVFEDYTQRDLEHFVNERISGIDFAKKGDYMEVMFCNDYISVPYNEIYEEFGYDKALFSTEPKEITNHAYIRCKSIPFNFEKIGMFYQN